VPVDVFAEIADERRQLADLLTGLSAAQLSAPSLCEQWTVHDVAAHLITPLEVSIPRFALTMVASRGDFDRANVRMTRRQARRPIEDIVDVLRRKAGTRFTPPGAGPEAPLTDLLVHALDIRRPLGLTRAVHEARLQTSLTHVTSPRGRDLVPRGAAAGLRFEASDIDWAHGSGPTVCGTAEDLLLAITGRTSALGLLSGDGLPTLQARLLGTASARSSALTGVRATARRKR
jgi:uncharacterized protein (TIGR03083 family)